MIIHPPLFLPHRRILCGMSTRLGGQTAGPLGMNLSFAVGDDEEAVKQNRETFFGALGIHQDDVVFMQQVHGTRVLSVAAPAGGERADGSVTSVEGVYLSVTVADCVPLFLADPDAPAVGVLHAGWKGTVGGIVREGVRTMMTVSGARVDRLLVAIGSSAARCCYEVGPEVADVLPPSCVTRDGSRLLADLKEANRLQLVDAGVPERNITVDPACTICAPGIFHSYRRDGVRSGRMMGVIGIRPLSVHG